MDLSRQTRAQGFYTSVRFSLFLGIPVVLNLRERRQTISNQQIDHERECHMGC
jgi:hypothetical protein